ncbi:hypothetical protein GBAR_LOCUS4077 [Geodia barretti]|uniref:Uncharacterized protein n=1 Tax=Geodia barretti TaxID=519541 RepID=A0AA35R6B1_GEOBA|nr:hypothetical protein GBAR_LOCUS4077 [Geodia barretti]
MCFVSEGDIKIISARLCYFMNFIQSHPVVSEVIPESILISPASSYPRMRHCRRHVVESLSNLRPSPAYTCRKNTVNSLTPPGLMRYTTAVTEVRRVGTANFGAGLLIDRSHDFSSCWCDP